MAGIVLTKDMENLILSGQAPAGIYGLQLNNGSMLPINPSVLEKTNNAQQIGGRIDINAKTSSSIADEWMRLMDGSKESNAEANKPFTVVANELAASLSSDKEKVDQGYINRKLTEVMDETGSTPAQAALIIKQSIKGADAESWNPIPAFNRWMDGTPRLSNNFQIDSNRLKKNIDSVKNGTIEKDAVAISEQEVNLADLMAAKSAVEHYQKELEIKNILASEGYENAKAMLPMLEKEYENAKAYFQEMQIGFENKRGKASGLNEMIDPISEQIRLKKMREAELAVAEMDFEKNSKTNKQRNLNSPKIRYNGNGLTLEQEAQFELEKKDPSIPDWAKEDIVLPRII